MHERLDMLLTSTLYMKKCCRNISAIFLFQVWMGLKYTVLIGLPLLIPDSAMTNLFLYSLYCVVTNIQYRL